MRQDLALRGNRNRARRITRAASPANAIRSAASLGRNRARNREAASAAAAANRLRGNAPAVIAKHIEQTSRRNGNCRARTRRAACAASRAGSRIRIRCVQASRDRETARTAAAANRLRGDRCSIGPFGDDAANIADRNRASIARRTASPAANCRRSFALDRQRAAHAKAARTAAAANRLRQDRARLIAKGVNARRMCDRNRAGITGRPAAAAGGFRRSAGIRGQGCTNRKAASAAATANRLGDDRARRQALGDDVAIDLDRYRVRIARRPTSACAGIGSGITLKRGTKPNGKAASTAAAANRLRKHAARVGPVGLNIAGNRDINRASAARRTAAATGRIRSCRAIRRQPSGNREAAQTAAAANRLRQHAAGRIALGHNRAGLRHANRACRTRRTAGPAANARAGLILE